MAEYMLLMHDDTVTRPSTGQWDAYFATLRETGAFDGGSSIGSGKAIRDGAEPAPVTRHIAGFIRVRAANMDDALRFVRGNPVFECGGTVEVRQLLRG